MKSKTTNSLLLVKSASCSKYLSQAKASFALLSLFAFGCVASGQSLKTTGIISMAPFPSGKLLLLDQKGRLQKINTAVDDSVLETVTGNFAEGNARHIAAYVNQQEFLLAVTPREIEWFLPNGGAAGHRPIPLPFTGEVGGIAVDSFNRRAYLSEMTAGTVWAIALDRGTSTRLASTRVFEKLVSMAVDSARQIVFVADAIQAKVYFIRINELGGPRFWSLADGDKSYRTLSAPYGLAYNERRQEIYVADEGRGAIYSLNASSDQALKGAGLEWGMFRGRANPYLKKTSWEVPSVIAFDHKGRLWVFDRRSNQLFSIDPSVTKQEMLIQRQLPVSK